MPAAAGAAAAAAARRGLAEARLPTGPVRREHRDLATDVRGAAVGALGVVPVPNELLEVRLARHADVLVNRHARDATSRVPSTCRRFGSRAGARRGTPFLRPERGQRS